VLQAVLDDGALAADLRTRAHERARRSYWWDAVTDGYERWLAGLLGAR
jgi:hypothetical protein